MTEKAQKVWVCPDCQWEVRAHPIYGWLGHDEHAVVVHRTMLCPAITPPGEGA